MNIRRRANYEIPLKIDIGCSDKCKNGYVGIDIEDRGQQVVWDVRQGLPFPDNSVEEIHSSHFIEHIEDIDLMVLIPEILRVCKNGTEVYFICPESNHIEAYYKSHVSLWNEQKVKGVFFGETNFGRFEFIEIKKEGMEISWKLKVIK